MSTETAHQFDLKEHLRNHYEVAQVARFEVEDVVLNPADDRLPFSGSGLNIESLVWRKNASGIPAEFYPIVFDLMLAPSKNVAYQKTVRLMKAGRARYDEGNFARPPGAVLDSRYTLAFLMKSHGVASIPTRFSDDADFVVRTADELMDAVRLHGLFLATFTQNFLQLGMPFYHAAGVQRCDEGFESLMKESVCKYYKRVQTRPEWVSYYRYVDIIFAFGEATEEQRKNLYASILAAETIEDISVSLGGRIQDNLYIGTGKYPPMSLRYSAELALTLVKHGIVRPDIESGTLELTDAGRKLIELLPETLDDPDRYGHFLDFAKVPPSIPAHQSLAVQGWLMDYFETLKAVLPAQDAGQSA
ncbi:hypothetical protein G6L37_06635 [Agrobacterium rubi]|nr:hypothetical protein [Agrobacterium rubi]NTF25040.1 hypothetical protein [Agrobacterium rubi]